MTPSSSSLHSDDFNITSLDETTQPSLNVEQSKKKSTLDYVQQAAWQLNKQDKIPWRQYTKHLKQKWKTSRNVPAPVDPIDNSDHTTPV